MTYLFDNDISPKLAKMLRELGVDAWALREAFPENTPDTDYLPELGNRGWVLVTKDRHIRTRPVEAKALAESGVTALFLGPFFGKLTFWAQATWLVNRWPEIEKFASRIDPGTIGLIKQRGAPQVISLRR